MAKTPNQVSEERINRVLADDINAMERKIDEWLVSRSGDYQGFHIPSMPPDALREIERRFTAAGWKVARYGDQRDGDYWTFK